jgi:hypothetical protein
MIEETRPMLKESEGIIIGGFAKIVIFCKIESKCNGRNYGTYITFEKSAPISAISPTLSPTYLQ